MLDVLHDRYLQSYNTGVVVCALRLLNAYNPAASLQFLLLALISDLYRSIKKFTDAYKEKKYPIHVLLNNAAIQSPKGKRGAKTEEGFEV